MSISNPASFRAEAAYQRVCAECGEGGAFDAHHVVARALLKRMGLVHLLYDPHNALRLCDRCHERYTNRVLVIETATLTDANLCFIWAVLGVAGHNYLDRHYTGIDRRYTLHEEGVCALCQ
jgi:hypothetical protein